MDIKKERLGGVDLFRVISMFMVVVLHVNGIGGVLRNPANQPLSPLWFASSVINILCVIAVNCFALITGFVNVEKKFKIKNLISLWLQAFFISVVAFLIKVGLKEETFSITLLLKSMLPVIFNEWWYFTAYFLLFFFIPILNSAMEKYSKVCMGALIIVLGVAFCGLGYISPYDVFGLIDGYSFLWLAYLYLIGAYIKKYNLKIKVKGKPIKSGCYLLGCLLASFLHFAINMVYSYLSGWTKVPVQSNYLFVLNVLSAVLLLLYFVNINVKSSKALSFFSSTTFGVYLIHMAIGVTDKFAFLLNYHWIVTVIGVFACAIALYLGCTFLEYLRQLLFKACKIPQLTQKMQDGLLSVYEKIKAKYDLEEDGDNNSSVEIKLEEIKQV